MKKKIIVTLIIASMVLPLPFMLGSCGKEKTGTDVNNEMVKVKEFKEKDIPRNDDKKPMFDSKKVTIRDTKATADLFKLQDQSRSKSERDEDFTARMKIENANVKDYSHYGNEDYDLFSFESDSVSFTNMYFTESARTYLEKLKLDTEFYYNLNGDDSNDIMDYKYLSGSYFSEGLNSYVYVTIIQQNNMYVEVATFAKTKDELKTKKKTVKKMLIDLGFSENQKTKDAKKDPPKIGIGGPSEER